MGHQFGAHSIRIFLVMCVENSIALFHLVPWGRSCIQTTGIKSSQLTLFNYSPINLFGTTNLIWYSLLSAHNMLYDAAKFWLTLKARWTSSIYHYFMTFDLMFCFVLWFLLLLICTFFCLLLLLLLSLGICNSVCVCLVWGFSGNAVIFPIQWIFTPNPSFELDWKPLLSIFVTLHKSQIKFPTPKNEHVGN